MDYDPALRLEGVVLNRVGGDAHTQWLREAVEASGVATRVLGEASRRRAPPGALTPDCERHLQKVAHCKVARCLWWGWDRFSRQDPRPCPVGELRAAASPASARRARRPLFGQSG